jgi:hypothetical protein
VTSYDGKQLLDDSKNWRLDRKKLKVSLQAGKPVAIRAELIHNDLSVFGGI